MHWSNWSGKLTSTPRKIEKPRSEADVIAIVRQAKIERSTIRCVGAAHSHSPLVVTDETIVDLAALSGVVSSELQRQEATLYAGSRIESLGKPLRDVGLALRNQGDIDRQAIAGAVATGTHGTGRSLQNLSASVVAARIVLADATVVDCSRQNEPALFEVSRLSLGAIGIVTQLTLALRDAYRLEERMWLENIDEVLDRIDERMDATRHFEFFWLPGKSRAACKSLQETLEPARDPVGDEGSRLGWSDEVLANERLDRHTEMEFSIPYEAGPECFRSLQNLIQKDFPDLEWPVEYRSVAKDDVWLSPARGRSTVTISVHQGIGEDDRFLFAACQEIFRTYDGRPHWGKAHSLERSELERLHPNWSDWWRIRNHYDPDGRFLNRALMQWMDA